MSKENRPLRVLITAGGTKVRIDDVRHISNFAKGGFGTALGCAFADCGAEVTLLGSDECLDRLRYRGLEDRFHQVFSFSFYEELHQRLFGLIRDVQPDIVLMSAAVSDWLCAKPHVGKIASDEERMSIEFVRAPKIIKELRQACGIKSFLVGFKLLSRSSHEELMERAVAQVRDNRLNLTIANDLSKIQGGQHPVTLVTPEGGRIPIEGDRPLVAEAIVEFILHRYAVAWSKTIWKDTHRLRTGDGMFMPDPNEYEQDQVELFSQVVDSLNVIEGCEGNFSWRECGTDDFYITPRKVKKQRLRYMDLCFASYDSEAHEVHCSGYRKSSIDSCVHGALYQYYSDEQKMGFLHFHNGFVVPDAVTRFPYPCGTHEEADEIIKCLQRVPEHKTQSWMIELKHHGYLMMLRHDDVKRLSREFFDVQKEYERHVYAVGRGQLLRGQVYYPIFASASIVGLVVRLQDGNAGIYLSTAARGKGVGAMVARELCRRGWPVITDPGCQVVDYYAAHGWRPEPIEAGLIRLVPPSMRDDMRDAVTVCVVNPHEKTVLLGQRLTKTWNEMWAFIGGEVDEGEEGQPVSTGKREAEEEVKMSPYPSHDQLVATTFATVGTNGGFRAYRVKTLIYFVDEMPGVSESDEMLPKVFSFEEARALPMGPGTKSVLSRAIELAS